MARETFLADLVRFLTTWLDIQEQRDLVKGIPDSGFLFFELPQRDSRFSQAQALVDLLDSRGRIDDGLMLKLVSELPDLHGEICSLAISGSLSPPPAPPPSGRLRLRSEGVPLPVLVVEAPIGENIVSVRDEEVYAAIAPDRVDGKIERLNLGNAGFKDGSPESLHMAQQLIKQKVLGFTETRLGSGVQGLAPVFGFGPIPVLAALGAALGNKLPVRVMQRYNLETPAWKWCANAPSGGAWQVPVGRRQGRLSAHSVGLLLSVSGHADITSAKRHLPNDAPIWEIRIAEPARDQIQTEAQLDEFRRLYSRTIAQIERTHGPEVSISIFPAVPIAIAVALGQTLIPKSMPGLHIYDYRSTTNPTTGQTNRTFEYALTLSGPPLPA